MVNIDVRFFYIAQNALHAGGDKEILLNEPQTPSFVRAVVGVEKLRDAFHHLLVALPVLPLPLRGEPVSGKIAINLRVPEAERIHRVIFCADHRHIVGHSQHCRIAFVHQLQRPVVLLPHISVAAKAYINRLIRLSILPCESVAQPTVRQLNLIAIDNFLFEKPIFIANTAPVRGKRQRCHRVNEASGEPPEPAVAQPGVRRPAVRLWVASRRVTVPMPTSGATPSTSVSTIVKPSQKKLDRKIINLLRLLFPVHPIRPYPVLGEQFLYRRRDRPVNLLIG